MLDHNGTVHSYDSEDSARSMLLDAGYVQFGGMDEDDALERGFSLAELFRRRPTATPSWSAA